MEPDRKIEKLLRAYANKRRADAGKQSELPPATRRLLQAEAARRAVKPEDEDSISLWQLFRQQWAFLLGFAIIIFCLATIFLPALNTTKRQAESLAAAKTTNEVAEQLALAKDDKAESRDEVVPTATRALKAPVSREEPEGVVTASAPPAEVPAQAAPPQLDRAFGGAANTFAYANSKALANSFKNSASPANTTMVLANFRIQQNGGALRVLDSDGSVYDGTWQAPNVAAQNVVPLKEKSGLASTQTQGLINGVQATTLNYSFEVAGTNLTLGQSVVFNGNLIVIAIQQAENQVTTAPNNQAQNALGPQTANQSLQYVGSNVRIMGTALVANTNQIQINATSP